MRVGLGVARQYLHYLEETEEERNWIGFSKWELAAIDLHYRPHDRWFIGVEGARFQRTKGRDYEGQNFDYAMVSLGGDIRLPALFKEHSQHRFCVGAQIEYGRTGGASTLFRNWTWQRGGSVYLSYSGRSPFTAVIRGLYRHHVDSDGSGTGLRISYRLIGFYLGLQYRFWKR